MRIIDFQTNFIKSVRLENLDLESYRSGEVCLLFRSSSVLVLFSVKLLFLKNERPDHGQKYCIIKDRPGSLFQPGPGPGPGSAKSAGTGILPGPGL